MKVHDTNSQIWNGFTPFRSGDICPQKNKPVHPRSKIPKVAWGGKSIKQTVELSMDIQCLPPGHPMCPPCGQKRDRALGIMTWPRQPFCGALTSAVQRGTQSIAASISLMAISHTHHLDHPTADRSDDQSESGSLLFVLWSCSLIRLHLTTQQHALGIGLHLGNSLSSYVLTFI